MKAEENGSSERIRAKVTREEQAAAELGHTEFAPGVRMALVVGFLAVITAVPLVQFTLGNRRDAGLGHLGKELSGLLPDAQDRENARGLRGALGLLPTAEAIKLVEDDWERSSVVGEAVLPAMQSVLLSLGQGNEKAYVGRDGWLFYRPDVDHVTGRGFLDPEVMRRRAAAVQPDPVRAIADFQQQLAARGIALLVVPAPVKPSVHPEAFGGGVAGGAPWQNPSFAVFVERLRSAGVAIYDPSGDLMAVKASGASAYLKTDTHWTAAAMEVVAAKVAAQARTVAALPAAETGRYKPLEQKVTGTGDIALMLKAPDRDARFPDETITLHAVTDGQQYWRPSSDAAVLLLGDSFTNIYSLQPMGWGESAGFAEHLSTQLGLPLDAICRNDAGAHATREMLARELQRGHDRLAGKKLVIWEFAARELSSGDWKLLPLTLGEKKSGELYTPAAGAVVRVRGTVRAASPVPRPGSVPYKDHIMTIRLSDLESPDDPAAAGRDVIVFVWSKRDHVPTAASRLRIGDTVEFRLRPWAEVAGQYEAINRSELDDDDAMLADPAWAE
jgi:alginate O-acetyltransferase complex protein AlgJ